MPCGNLNSSRLQKCFEIESNYSIPLTTLLAEYEAYCKTHSINSIQPQELITLVQKVFSPQAVLPGQPITIRGVRPRPGIFTTPESAHIFPEPQDELRGSPLTALLVMRNLARHPNNRRLFLAFESDLANLWTDAKFSKLVGAILSELK